MVNKRKVALLHQFIIDYTLENTYPPTRREMAEELGIRVVMAQYYLDVLKEEGKVIVTPGIARGIRLV